MSGYCPKCGNTLCICSTVEDKMKVFVAHEISYDYYRFEDFLGVFADRDTAVKESKEAAFFGEGPILFGRQASRGWKEEAHILIEEVEVK